MAADAGKDNVTLALVNFQLGLFLSDIKKKKKQTKELHSGDFSF